MSVAALRLGLPGTSPPSLLAHPVFWPIQFWPTQFFLAHSILANPIFCLAQSGFYVWLTQFFRSNQFIVLTYSVLQCIINLGRGCTAFLKCWMVFY